jgi:hypothetical protein
VNEKEKITRTNQGRLMERTKKILICVLIVLGAGLRADQQPGLFGRYYTGLALDTEHMARVDPVIDFNWDGNEPTPTKPFSISWSGHVQAPADGTYTFYTVTDDGVRLWLDTAGDGATMIIDEWIDQSATEHQAVVELTAGSYPVRMDYYEKSGNASTQLWWRGPGIEKQIIPAANLRCDESFTLPVVLPPEPKPPDGCLFVDKSKALEINFQHADGIGFSSRHTIAWVDYDNDGFVDLCDGLLWRNDGGRQITPLPLKIQVGPNSYEAGPGIFADVDNDGYLDRFGWRNHLKVAQMHRNLAGSGEFEEIPIPKLPQVSPACYCWADLNGDGFVDLFIGGGANSNETDSIMMNDRAASFTVQPIGGNFYTRTVTACDYDEDNDMDVMASRYWFQPNALFQNDGNGKLTDVGAAAGVHGVGHTISSVWGDFDNDGHFDLFHANLNHHDGRRQDDATLYRNLGPAGNWQFEKKKAFDGPDWQESYGCATAADFDNDGDLDLYITAVYEGNKSQLFRNDGGWTFTSITAAAGLDVVVSNNQAGSGDYDNDGDVDLVTDGKVFQNKGNDNHWLSVRLAGNGKTVNRAAIGAQVRIEVPGIGTMTRQVESGGAQGSANDLVLHFGFGDHAADVDLHIAWPDDTTQRVTTALDRIIDVEQPDDSLLVARVEAAVAASRGKPIHEYANTFISRTAWEREGVRVLAKEPDGRPKLDRTSARGFIGERIVFVEENLDFPAPAPFTVPKATGPVTIDGKLDDAAWQSAVVFRDSYPISERSAGGPATEWRILWDDSFLYFAFDCTDTDLVAPEMKRDAPVYSDDCVEMFILPQLRTGSYWELVISPSDSVFDSLHSKSLSEWASINRSVENIEGLQRGVVCNGTLNQPGDTDTGYTIEVAVPFSQLPEYSRSQPAAGHQLRLMLVRLDKTGKDSHLVYSFQPLLNWGHNIWNHALMTLGE